MSFDYDLFVIGGGSGGVRAARIAASEGGAKVALAEESRMGGTCVIRGCVPKKLMVFASEYPSLMQDAAAYGCHLDIPLAPSVFLANAHAALRMGIAQGRGAMRFIDVGCGGGVKVMLAAEVFAQADGLEYDPGYVAAAQAAFRLMSVPRARVFQADAMNFDGYGDYDVIFFYQPMQSAEDLKQLERRIITMAPPGTILIAPYVQFAARAAGLGCGHVGGAVYLSATDQPRTDALRARAETTGTGLIRPGAPIDPRDGCLTPLIEAARRIGFDLD